MLKLQLGINGLSIKGKKKRNKRLKLKKLKNNIDLTYYNNNQMPCKMKVN